MKRIVLLGVIALAAIPGFAAPPDFFALAPQASPETVGTPRDLNARAVEMKALQQRLAAGQVEKALGRPIVVQLTGAERQQIDVASRGQGRYLVGVAKPVGTTVNFSPARALDKSVYKVPVENLPAIGNPQALVTIVLFSDYECPYCKRLDADLQRMREESGGDVRILVAQRPLPFHPVARPAAAAALAASAQGKFEAMHRALYALEKVDDYVSVALEWLGKARKVDPEARYPFLMWNCLWRAGSSVVHGHAQDTAARGAHYHKVEHLRRVRHEERLLRPFPVVHVQLVDPRREIAIQLTEGLHIRVRHGLEQAVRERAVLDVIRVDLV